MLGYLRLATLTIATLAYYYEAPDVMYIKVLVGIALVAFITNHFFILSIARKSQLFYYLLAIDCAWIVVLGLFFPSSTLHLILLGVEVLTLFLFTGNKKILTGFTLFLFTCTAIIFIHSYILLGTIEIISTIMNLILILLEAVVGGLIHKLGVARSNIDVQYDALYQSHRALKDAHEQLRVYAKEVEELTAVRERNQIARDIHDTVGHHITALIVQLELAQELYKKGLPQAPTLQTCTELARTTLQEIRMSVRALKEEDAKEVSFLPVIQTIIHDFSKATGVTVTFEMEGDPTIILSSMNLSISKIIQESLTNSVRHGKATVCAVTISCTENTVEVKMDDNGIGTSQLKQGFGLMNMKERVEEHGGKIVFTSEENEGFHIFIQFPLFHDKRAVGGVV